MLIRHYTSELVRNDRDVEDIIYVDDDHGQIPFLRLVKLVKQGKFDVVFHTHPRFRIALLTWIARIPHRIGTGYRWYSFLFNNRVYEHRKDAKYHELEYNLHLIRALGLPEPSNVVAPSIAIDHALLQRMSAFLKDRGIADDEEIVMLHPGSGGSARNWSAEKFGALARKLSEVRGVRVVVTGGPGEDRIVGSVMREAGPLALAFVDTFSLMEFAAVASRARMFVANSTGTLHIAAAVGTSVIGFFPQHASLSAARWGPYTERRIIFSPENQPADCNKCVHRTPAKCDCMETISVDRVFDAALRSLREFPAAAHASGASVSGASS